MSMLDEQPPLFEGEPEHCSLCGEAGHTHDDHWLFQHDVVRALQARLAWAVAEREQADRLFHGVAAERDELKAELRKYEPSDGVMHQRLAMYEAIAQAAELLEERHNPAEESAVTRWLALPVVSQARKALRGD